MGDLDCFLDDDYSAADARFDDAQDQANALHAEALDAYGAKEVLEAIGEHMTADLLRLIRCGDKRAGVELLTILTADVEAFCANWVEATADDAEHQAELVAAAGRTP